MKSLHSIAIMLLTGVTVLLSATTVYAGEPVTQTLVLESGWNIVSTPNVLESHQFSAEETSENFDIYLLDPSSPTGWVTMADLGQSEFTPLYGYFINNKTDVEQALVFNYDTTLEPNEKLFERSFSTEGWYSIGVANAEYAKAQSSDRTDNDNPSRILSLIENKYDLVIDFTDDVYWNNRNSLGLSDPWKAAVPVDVDSLNDFRDTKGYAIYIKDTDARYSGFQNDPVAEVALDDSLTLESSDDDLDATTFIVDEDDNEEHMVFSFDLSATDSGESIVINEIVIDFVMTSNDVEYTSIDDLVNDFRIELDGESYGAESWSGGGLTATVVFDIDGDTVVPEGEKIGVEVFVEFDNVDPAFSGATIQASVKTTNIDAEGVDDVLVGGSDEGGEIHTLRLSGIIAAFDSEVSDIDASGNTLTMEFVVDIEAFGRDSVLTVADFNYSTTGPAASTPIINVTLDAGDPSDENPVGTFTLDEGDEATYTFTVYVTTRDADDAGLYTVILNDIDGEVVDEDLDAVANYSA